MAVTAHYIVRIEGKHLTLKARLIAFKHIEGRHDGVSLAHAFFGVLEEEGVAPKVCGRDSSAFAHKQRRAYTSA